MSDSYRKGLARETRLPNDRALPAPRSAGGAPRLRPETPARDPAGAVPASLTYTPESSALDPSPEHDFREEVESALLARDFSRAQRSIGTRLRDRRYHDTALHLLGIVRLCLSDTDSARDCLGQALRLRQEFDDMERRVSTRTALARVEMDCADFTSAWQHLDRALALDPLSLHVHWNRLCLARSHFAYRGPGEAAARDRLESACAAMASIDPGWQDDRSSSPFLLSLK